jgi:hypothetical protein
MIAMAVNNRGAELNRRWNVGAVHALYMHDGHWYHCLKHFPGALFDRNGYILFSTEEEYLDCSYLTIYKATNQIAVMKPGISAIPGYVRVTGEMPQDVDFHSSSVGIEGEMHLKLHLFRERDRSIVKLKKKSASSLNCEICGFSFQQTYGGLANDYCEVHHLVPISELEEATEIRMADLVILCANCHRVVHLHNPPYTLQQVRKILQSPLSAS